MIHINAIPEDYEPRRKILSMLPDYVSPKGEREPEMSESQSAFLCGAIKQLRPKKILEVGVAGGATTAIVLQTLEDLGEPYEMHSIDILANFYRDPSKSTGFLAEFAKGKIFGYLSGSHKFHLRKCLPQVIDEIGGDIDFVILDTMHILPGESLDFLAVLPYLKIGAVVILHDVSLNQNKPQYFNSNATAVLFSAVTAEKFLNFNDDERNVFRYPNISAFKINEQTVENIENVFLSMILRWIYMPSDEELIIYRRHYRRFYSAELCEIFQEAIDMNSYNLWLANRK